MAKTYEPIELPRGSDLNRVCTGRLAGFYSSGNPKPGSYPATGRQVLENSHLSQTRLFSARLRTTTPHTREWKLVIPARAGQTARSEPPLLS